VHYPLKGKFFSTMLKLLAKLVVIVLIMLPSVASAQAWLQDRKDSEGPGIRLGDSLIFHPGGGVEGGYDTNALRKSDELLDAGRLRATLYLDLATRSDKRRAEDEGEEVALPKLTFRLSAAGYYDIYFGKEQSIKDLNKDGIGADFRLNLVALPERPFSFLADATYILSNDPSEAGSDALLRHSIRPGIGFRIRPGGGTLSFELGYRFDYGAFADTIMAARNNKMTNNLRFITSWKVFPKTAIMSKVTFSPVLYTGSEQINNDSRPLRATFGLQGLITDRFGLSLFAGYGTSLYKLGDDFDSVIASGELMFFITPFSNIRIGGKRDFVDSYYANFYTNNGGYISYQQMFGGVFLATLKGELYHRAYSSMAGNVMEGWDASTDNRKDLWAESTLMLEFRVTDWLSFHASAEYQGDITDFEFVPNADNALPEATSDAAKFHKFEVLGGVRAHY